MKALILLFFTILSVSTINAQVGIKTVNPTKELDVNGELRVRNLPIQNPTDSFLVATDSNGNIGKSPTYYLYDVGSQIATTNVDRTLTVTQIVNNINLGLSTTVIIPANREAIVIINYSVPAGIPSQTIPNAYYGVRFLKNGIEAEAGSRKYSINTNNNVNMATINNIYTENFTSSPTIRTITYTLNGYIEQNADGTHTYRFNMWDTTPPNYNWGRGTITKQVFIK